MDMGNLKVPYTVGRAKISGSRGAIYILNSQVNQLNQFLQNLLLCHFEWGLFNWILNYLWSDLNIHDLGSWGWLKYQRTHDHTDVQPQLSLSLTYTLSCARTHTLTITINSLLLLAKEITVVCCNHWGPKNMLCNANVASLFISSSPPSAYSMWKPHSLQMFRGLL